MMGKMFGGSKQEAGSSDVALDRTVADKLKQARNLIDEAIMSQEQDLEGHEEGEQEDTQEMSEPGKAKIKIKFS
jgi:hypothetical protein